MKKPWLIGGLIFVLIDLALIVFAFLSSYPAEAQNLALNIVQYPFTVFTNRLDNNTIVIIGGLVAYFIMGSVLGWVVGKMRSKKD